MQRELTRLGRDATEQEQAADPTMKVLNVVGMYFFSPPISRMSKVWWAAWLTEPAPRNRQALNMAWVKRWNTAAVHAPTPSPRIM